MKKILGLGGVTTDQIGVVDHIPSSDEVIRLQEYRLQQGGMVATALVAAARLGAETEFLGAVGDDQNGRFAVERFAAEGVGTAGVRVVPGSISAFSFILVEKVSGKRTIIHEPGVQRNRRLNDLPGDPSRFSPGSGIFTSTVSGWIPLSHWRKTQKKQESPSPWTSDRIKEIRRSELSLPWRIL
jgi:sugar/nucleoside kinase (ribokinase family)